MIENMNIEIKALEDERQQITDDINGLMSDIGRPLPGRKIPSRASSKVDVLKRRLGVINLKLSQNRAKAHHN